MVLLSGFAMEDAYNMDLGIKPLAGTLLAMSHFSG
jgi:hypothetical protein